MPVCAIKLTLSSSVNKTFSLVSEHCCRLRQGRHEEASSDLREALSTGVGNLDEAKALLAEAEAGSALANCRDPEAKGRGDHFFISTDRQDAYSLHVFACPPAGCARDGIIINERVSWSDRWHCSCRKFRKRSHVHCVPVPPVFLRTPAPPLPPPPDE